MDINDYAKQASKTAIYPHELKSASSMIGLIYVILGIVSEIGELAGKLKKIIRDKHGLASPDDMRALMDENSDILWYWAMLCAELGFDARTVAQHNLDKLADRQKRNVLGGSGDSR